MVISREQAWEALGRRPVLVFTPLAPQSSQLLEVMLSFSLGAPVPQRGRSVDSYPSSAPLRLAKASCEGA